MFAGAKILMVLQFQQRFLRDQSLQEKHDEQELATRLNKVRKYIFKY